jgi:hypothetical protein
MAFLEITTQGAKRIINTDYILDVRIAASKISFQMDNNDADCVVSFDNDEIAKDAYEELKQVLQAKEFPSGSIYENRGLLTLG